MISCPNCGQTLDAGDLQAGATIKCPICERMFRVGGPARTAADGPPGSATQWHLLMPDGRQYGPENEGKLIGWIQEGRVPSGSMVWSSGMSDWTPVELLNPFAYYMPRALPDSSSSSNMRAYGYGAHLRNRAVVGGGQAFLWFLCCIPIGFMQWGQGGKGWVWVLISIGTGGLGGLVAWIDYWMSYGAQKRRRLDAWEFFPK